MDTKLKNRHKLAIVLILLIIAIPTMAVLSGYHTYSRESEELQNELDEAAFCSSDFLEEFVWASYIPVSYTHLYRTSHVIDGSRYVQ